MAQGIADMTITGQAEKAHIGAPQPISTPEVEACPESDTPYTVFARRQRNFIALMLTIGGFISPLAGNLYLPAVPELAKELDTPYEDIFLTITGFLIFQGLGCVVYGDLADKTGRRLATIVSLVLFVAANVGLACQNSFPALLALRCLQSAGTSGQNAINSGAAADISATSKRGTYMALVQSGTVLGPGVGPVLGGLLVQYLGWRSIFWFLAIFSSVFLLVYIALVPETARKLVGNGSLPPPNWWNRSILSEIARRRLAAHQPRPTDERNREVAESARARRFPMPNPLNVLRVFMEKDVALVTTYNAIVWASWYTVVATLAVELEKPYNLTTLQVGLCFIPFGFGAAVSLSLGGRLQDYHYQRLTRRHGLPKNHRDSADGTTTFPIERCRLAPLAPLLYLGVGTLVGFGWALEHRAPLALVLALTFGVGLLLTTVYNGLNVLLVDLYPAAPATASAANNLLRYLVGAAATAAIDPMIDGLGQGRAFTIVGAVVVALSPMLWVVVKCGHRWRGQRNVKLAARRESDG